MANRLVLELVADDSPLQRGLGQAQRSITQFTRSAGSLGEIIGGPLNSSISTFSSLAVGGARAATTVAGALAAAASASVYLTISVAKTIEAQTELSGRMGIAVQDIQRMSVMMAETNTSSATLTSAMRTLSKMIVEARDPASAAAVAFEQMGVTITKTATTEDILRQLADRFAAMPDGAEKARLAVELFGRGGLELIPTLNKGSAAFDESARAAERFGLVLRNDQIAALSAADDAVDRLGKAIEGLKTQLAVAFAPTVASGVETLTNAIATLTRVVQNLGPALESVQRSHPFISSLIPGFSALAGVMKAASMPPPPPPPPPPQPQDSHLGEWSMAHGARQEEIGRRLRLRHIEAFRAQQSQGRAQEALGGTLRDIFIREWRESQRNKPEPAMSALSEAELAQEERGWEIMRASIAAWRERNREQEIALGHARAMEEWQQALYDLDRGLLSSAEAVRAARFARLEEEAAMQRRIVEETIYEETRKAAALEDIDTRLHASRMRVAQEFPTFWQRQLQSVEDSNTFAIGSIVSTWTSGLSAAIVSGQNFGQVMKQVGIQTAQSVLQAILNMGVQMLASTALRQSLIIASESATAATTVAIWQGASSAIIGTFGTLTGAIMGFLTQTLIPAFMAIGSALMTFLASIAEAASATIFGIPYAAAILAGVGVIGGAIAALAAFAFADGGIVTRPTMGLVGEAGSAEAIIPLNARGAAFLREAIGGGRDRERPIHTHVYLDRREIAVAVSSSYRLMGSMP